MKHHHSIVLYQIGIVAALCAAIFFSPLPAVAQVADEEDPIVTITNPPEEPTPYATGISEISLQGEITDNTGIDMVMFEIARRRGEHPTHELIFVCGYFGVPRCEGNRIELPLFAPELARIRLNERENVIMVVVDDTPHNRTQVFRTVRYDPGLLDPVISLVSPRANAVLPEDTVVIEATVSANAPLQTVWVAAESGGGERFQNEICGAASSPCPGTAMNTRLFDADRSRVTLRPGSNRLIVHAIDAESRERERTVTIVHRPLIVLPKMFMQNPLPDIMLPTDRVNVRATISSDSPLTSVQISIRREGSDVVEERPICGGAEARACPLVSFNLQDFAPERSVVLLNRGANRITLSAQNGDGSVVDFRDVFYDPEFTGTETTFYSPLDEVSWQRANNAGIRFEVQSKNQLSNILLRVVRPGGAIVDVEEIILCGEGGAVACPQHEFKRSQTISDLREGDNQIFIVARDITGLETINSRVIKRDTRSPQIDISFPREGILLEDLAISVAATVSDNEGLGTVQLEIIRSGEVKEIRTICGPDPAPRCPGEVRLPDFALRASRIHLNEGTNSLKIVALDKAGNRARVQRTVTVPEGNLFLRAAHTPLQPEEARGVIVHATAERRISASNLTISIFEVGPDGEPTLRAECNSGTPVFALACDWTIGEPRPERIISYFTRLTEEGGRIIYTPVKHILIGNTGTDTDGDGIVDDIENLLCTNPNDPDSDRDTLLDGWEVFGVSTPDRQVLDLPGMYASPCLKDAFVEVDWMQDDRGQGKPSPTLLQSVIQIGRRAGFQFRFDVGNWGGGNATPLLGPDGQSYFAGLNNFFVRKYQNFDVHRLWAFHYLATGLEVDLSVFQGWNSVKANRRDHTFAHELGHSFHIGHGGAYAVGMKNVPTALPNQLFDGRSVSYDLADLFEPFEPNYLSLMSYSPLSLFDQTTRVILKTANYSDLILPTLTETHLDERPTSEFAIALQHYPRPPEQSSLHPLTNYFCRDNVRSTLYRVWTDGNRTIQKKRLDGDQWIFTEVPIHPSGIDWNCDGRIDADVSGDIDNSGSVSPEPIYGRRDTQLIPGLRNCRVYRVSQDGRKYPSDEELLAAGLPTQTCEGLVRSQSSSWSSPPPESDLIPFEEICDGLDNNRDNVIDENCADQDQDVLSDDIDNCPLDANPDQRDTDRDQIGDACAALMNAPVGFTVWRQGDAINLSWKPDPRAIGYAVYRRVEGENDFSYVGSTYPSSKTGAFVDQVPVRAPTKTEATTTSTAVMGSTDGSGTVSSPGPQYIEYSLRPVSYTTGHEGLPAYIRFSLEDTGFGSFQKTNLISAFIFAAIGLGVFIGVRIWARTRVGLKI